MNQHESMVNKFEFGSIIELCPFAHGIDLQHMI